MPSQKHRDYSRVSLGPNDQCDGALNGKVFFPYLVIRCMLCDRQGAQWRCLTDGHEMFDFYLIAPGLMSLRTHSCSGDASEMVDAKGQSHDPFAKAPPITMHSHVVLAGRRRSRYDR